MQLKRFRVTNFRSVINSGWINCDNVTTLIGVNESGKSNVLLALWKLKPASGGKIDPLHDLPVTKLSDLRDKKTETCFIQAVFVFGDSVNDINDQLNSSFSSEDEVVISRYYDGTYQYCFENDTVKKKVDLILKPRKAKKTADKIQINSEDILKNFIKHLPTFVYYSNYGNLTSRIYLPHAIKWLNGESISGVDIKEDQVRTIRVLFDYVNLKPQEILELGQDAKDLALNYHGKTMPTEEEIHKAQADKEKRSLLLQSAGTKLTKEFRDWWRQGEYKFRFGADGDYFYIWVSDDKRPEEVDLELRSTGLQWFLSFYIVFLMECKDEKENAVLLLDEAGLTLHPLAQRDLSIFFNKLSQTNQLINTTHSPFIIDPENIDRCRVVYTDNNGGTVVSENLREGSGAIGEKSIFAVHAALGLTVSDVLLQGCQAVVVEGVSDQFYLSSIKNALIRDKLFAPQRELVFVPAGGAKGVPGISGLVSSVNEGLPFVVLDSDKSGEDFKKKLEQGLYKNDIDKIVCVKDINGMEHSEIEDLIPFSLIENAVEKLLGVQDEDDEFEPETGKPIIPQIEKFAENRGIKLEQGWKVQLAKFFKKKLLGRKPKKVSDEYIKFWIKMFEKITE